MKTRFSDCSSRSYHRPHWNYLYHTFNISKEKGRLFIEAFFFKQKQLILHSVTDEPEYLVPEAVLNS